MNDRENSLIKRNYHPKEQQYTQIDALREFEELKNIALNCLDKNGNPNIAAALRALENKAKIAGLYSNKNTNNTTLINMNEITLDGEQLKLNIGENID